MRYKPEWNMGRGRESERRRNEIRQGEMGRGGQGGGILPHDPNPVHGAPAPQVLALATASTTRAHRRHRAVLRRWEPLPIVYYVGRKPKVEQFVQHDRALLQVQLRPRPTPAAPAP